MNVFIKNISTNPLRLTLLLSVFLHATGFYFLSNLSFDSTIRSPKMVPITVRPLIQRKEIKSMDVKHIDQETRSKSVKSPHLVSTNLKESFSSQPTPIYKKHNRTQLIQPTWQTQFPRDIGQISLTSINNSASSHIKLQSSFRPAVSMAAPRAPEKNRSSWESVNFSMKSSESIEESQKEPLPTASIQARANSNLKVDAPQKFTSTRLQKDRKLGGSNGLTLTVRNAALTIGFTEESLEVPKINNMAKAVSSASDSFSSLNIGELRRGFHRKVWLKVTAAKYYPRMARKMGFEGKPVVTFTLGTKGELLNLQLIQASSYNLLDEAALETIRRGTPYPPIPEPLGENSISFNLPISYILEE